MIAELVWMELGVPRARRQWSQHTEGLELELELAVMHSLVPCAWL